MISLKTKIIKVMKVMNIRNISYKRQGNTRHIDMSIRDEFNTV